MFVAENVLLLLVISLTDKLASFKHEIVLET